METVPHADCSVQWNTGASPPTGGRLTSRTRCLPFPYTVGGVVLACRWAGRGGKAVVWARW